MKSIRSMPVMSKLDSSRAEAKRTAKATLNRSQSLSNTAKAADAITHIIRNTPFLALPGIDSQLRGFSRSYSQFGLATATNQLLSGYGTFGRQRGSSFSSRSGGALLTTGAYGPGDTSAASTITISSSLGSSSSSSSSSSTAAAAAAVAATGGSAAGMYPPGSLPDDADADTIPPELLESKYTFSLALAVSCAVVSSFQVGFNGGVLNVPEAVIRESLVLSELEWSIAVSIICIGGLIGSYVGGIVSDTLGRKGFLVANNVFFIVGALLQALAHSFWMLAAGRLIIGIGCGCATVVVPLYLGEISPANLRGSLGTMNQFAQVIGLLAANLIGKPLGGELEWRYLLGLVLIPSLLQIVLSTVILESPLWLIMQGGSKSTVLAEEILVSLRGTPNVEFDLEVMFHAREATQMAQDANPHTGLRQLLLPEFRKPLVIGFLLQVAQQFSGINAVFYYSTAFFAQANVQDPWLGSVMASFVNVLATALALNLMDRFGRRQLIVVSSVGMMMSSLLLTAALNYPAAETWMSYASVATVLLFVTFFELGLGPIPWLIGAEIYPSEVRSVAMSMSSTINWLSNFLVSLSFPHLVSLLGANSFVPFAVVLLLCTIFTLLYVPETAGKSLEEIQMEMRGLRSGDDDEDGLMDDDVGGDFDDELGGYGRGGGGGGRGGGGGSAGDDMDSDFVDDAQVANSAYRFGLIADNFHQSGQYTY